MGLENRPDEISMANLRRIQAREKQARALTPAQQVDLKVNLDLATGVAPAVPENPHALPRHHVSFNDSPNSPKNTN